MTRISSLIVASTLAILPVAAFAQQTATPARTSGPTSLTAPMPNTDKTITDKTITDKTITDKTGTDKTVTGTTAMDKVTTPTSTTNTTQPVKTDAKASGHGVKNEVHGMNSGSAPHAKAGVPAKS